MPARASITTWELGARSRASFCSRPNGYARLRAAIEALPFESPKLSATAVLRGDDFATRLERATTRSGKAPLLIEGEVAGGER
jgi:hypothetical protein